LSSKALAPHTLVTRVTRAMCGRTSRSIGHWPHVSCTTVLLLRVNNNNNESRVNKNCGDLMKKSKPLHPYTLTPLALDSKT